MNPKALLHGLPPVVGPATRLLLLGSFPGLASLAAQQYYAHPRNQFWPLLSSLWGVDLRALSYPARLDELRERGLGLWDIYASCRRVGSLDSEITDGELNPLAEIPATMPFLCTVAYNDAESERADHITRTRGEAGDRVPQTSPGTGDGH